MPKESVTTRVLLVEDDEDDYLLALELLEQAPDSHCHVDWVRSPEQALEALRTRRPHAVLLDYRLGGGCGLDLLRAARGGGFDGPVIMLTGQADREVDVAAMRAGATDYLVKGELNPALIERTVRYALERQRLASELASTGRCLPEAKPSCAR